VIAMKKKAFITLLILALLVLAVGGWIVSPIRR